MADDRTIVTIGNFDGVHLGHQSLLTKARAIADAHDARVEAMTFEPHPISILRADQAPPKIMTLDQRRSMLAQAGADDVRVIELTKAVLAMTPEQFVEAYLAGGRVLAIVEGPNFRFGARRHGDVDLLSSLGDKHGFATHIESTQHVDLHDQLLAPLSSSLIRWLIGRGRVADAARCMGRPFELRGKIVKGEQRGRTIGFPTANLDPDAISGMIVPINGVYAGNMRFDDEPQTYPAAISIGIKPTFGKRRLTVEAHLAGFGGDAYGRVGTLRFDRWLRDQYAFPSASELVQQLHRDVEHVQRLAG